MPKLRVHNYAMSLDGYGAGPEQSLEDPMGVGGRGLHGWAFETATMRAMQGMEGGEHNLDDAFIARGDAGVGATIMGRNMFGPIRGDWGDDTWRGWWGDNPPYHHPVFVLTHHPHDPIEMDGGTTFNFVGDIETAYEHAMKAAAGSDVRLGGGASAVQQYMRAGLLDEIHIAVVPITLGGGERLFDHLDGAGAAYECVEFVSSPAVAHVVLRRST